MGSASARPSRASWANIPEAAAEELRQIVAHNDTNPSTRITAEAAIKRMRERWGWQTTHSTLIRYCRRVLGRDSWATP